MKLRQKISNFIEVVKFKYLDFTSNEKIFHYASSLSFYSIFSLVPILLVTISFLQGVPFFKNKIHLLLHTLLENVLPSNLEDVTVIVNKFLTNGKELGIVGFLVALISSFVFFRSYDDISARIFHSKKRSIFDSFITYWLFLTLIPLMFALSVYFGSLFYKESLFKDLWQIFPFIATWVLFGILFRISANSHLTFSALAISSLLGATIWFISKLVFFYYMSYNKFYSTIYGSLSVVMFLMLWVYVSWLIFLIAMRFCRKLDVKLKLMAEREKQKELDKKLEAQKEKNLELKVEMLHERELDAATSLENTSSLSKEEKLSRLNKTRK
ncbi:hypothetical protein BKH43_02375 [Helicobacter sp. 13S00401-1]|uniref:YihY/virulence factor BrkB family protein n=1 Tax=Helicobacter sp. 13S00401-1 TaxID=1905758 RepID=UPI000BA50D17|nr:YhjD/YihY/BrkB family envelope integrity protein [Helicobacter sp. 13S00401-1]PAF51075.1 hypothetical protein BKH43_02375 [Helicobacter sp. 13S00401-1]